MIGSKYITMTGLRDLTKLVSSQTLPEATARVVLLKKVFLKMAIDTHEGEIFKSQS